MASPLRATHAQACVTQSGPLLALHPTQRAGGATEDADPWWKDGAPCTARPLRARPLPWPSSTPFGRGRSTQGGRCCWQQGRRRVRACALELLLWHCDGTRWETTTRQARASQIWWLLLQATAFGGPPPPTIANAAGHIRRARSDRCGVYKAGSASAKAPVRLVAAGSAWRVALWMGFCRHLNLGENLPGCCSGPASMAQMASYSFWEASL